MRVEIRYLAEIKRATSTTRENIEMKNETNLKGILEEITSKHDDKLRERIFNSSDEISDRISIFINGEYTKDNERKIEDGDTITITSAIGGGGKWKKNYMWIQIVAADVESVKPFVLWNMKISLIRNYQE